MLVMGKLWIFLAIVTFLNDQSKNGRYFGGLAILYKDELKPGIKLLPIMNSNFHWFILKKDFLILKKTFILVLFIILQSNLPPFITQIVLSLILLKKTLLNTKTMVI
jgi:hypothetical protein